MATTFRDMQVTINISDVDAEEIYPERVVVLQHPEWSINVGRGNSTDESLTPQHHNTWFASRVMSRHHATLKAAPKEKRLFITDAGSMHGTFINGQRITMDQPYELLQEDIITFGGQVVRGDDIFPPLKVAIHFAWSEHDQTPQPKAYPNSFTADYSEEDVPSDISDDEVEIIRESIKEPSVEILSHPFIKQMPTIISSPSINSEPSLPSESDPTSVSVIEAEETQPKIFDVQDEDVELDNRSRESSLDSDRYSPSLDENNPVIITATEHVDLPLKTSVPLESPTAITTTRNPSPSDAAMAKAAPVEPKFDIRPPNTVSKLGNLMHDGSQPWVPSLFDFNSKSFGMPFGYSVSHQYLQPPALGPYNVPLPSPPPPPTLSIRPTVRDPCTEASWFSDTLEPRVVIPPTVMPRLGSHAIASCSRKRKAYEISGQPEKVTSNFNTTSKDAIEYVKSAKTAQEPFTVPTDMANTDTVNTATTPTSRQEVEVLPSPSADDSPAATELQPTAEPVEEVSVDEPQRKKIKKTRDAKSKVAIKPSSTSSQIMKYVATAFAGATVGAIGTVFGLAALPPDFFA